VDKIQFQCSGCGKGVSAPADRAGKNGKCPSCGVVLQIPNASGRQDQAPSSNVAQLVPQATTTAGGGDGEGTGTPTTAGGVSAWMLQLKTIGNVLKLGHLYFYRPLRRKRETLPQESWLLIALLPPAAAFLVALLLCLFARGAAEGLFVGAAVVTAVSAGVYALLAVQASVFGPSVQDAEAALAAIMARLQGLRQATRALREEARSVRRASAMAPPPLPSPSPSRAPVLAEPPPPPFTGRSEAKWGDENPHVSKSSASGAGNEPRDLPKKLTLDLGRRSGLWALTGSHVKLELVLIPAGRFVMGSPPHEKGRSELECLPIKVTISRPYYMGKYPVTQEQYEKIMGQNLSDMKGPRNPVERISWNDASDFCRKLSALTGQAVRLPTMAEWEYACRAGTTTRFCSGDSNKALNRVGWYEGNSRRTTHPVGQKKPNRWGLYDMHGNVYEWCQDVSGGQDYFGSGPVTDPIGPDQLDGHALCGGCWDSSADDCRSAAGMECDPEPRNNIVGFRVVVDTGYRSSSVPNP